MRPWQFRQKTIGFGISKNAYLTVLAARAQLPVVAQVMNPRGDQGALEGFLVPLARDSTKDDLTRPLARGLYAASSKDRKTVMRMMVMSKEEAGFDPAPFLRSELAQSFSPEVVQRVAATWTLIQLSFETHDPFVHSSLRLWLSLAARLAELTDGVVADGLTQTYKLPGEVFVSPQADPAVDARDHVRVHEKVRSEGLYLYSLGASKFNFSEIEMAAVSVESRLQGQSLLLSLAQSALLGKPYGVGDKIPTSVGELTLGPGGLDRAQWDGIPCLELLPPTGVSMGAALAAWAEGN